MTLPIPPEEYAFAPADAARHNGCNIDLHTENEEVSIYLQDNYAEFCCRKYPVVFVQGFTPPNTDKPVEITEISKLRLLWAVESMRVLGVPVVLVSGGNVHPSDTPYNEAWQMKQHLLERYGLKNSQIALEPYARHSTTNLRNGARFLLAHKYCKALVVSTILQSFYYSFGCISGFTKRCKVELGYPLGSFSWRGFHRTRLLPGSEVFIHGTDPLDP